MRHAKKTIIASIASCLVAAGAAVEADSGAASMPPTAASASTLPPAPDEAPIHADEMPALRPSALVPTSAPPPRTRNTPKPGILTPKPARLAPATVGTPVVPTSTTPTSTTWTTQKPVTPPAVSIAPLPAESVTYMMDGGMAAPPPGSAPLTPEPVTEGSVLYSTGEFYGPGRVRFDDLQFYPFEWPRWMVRPEVFWYERGNNANAFLASAVNTGNAIPGTISTEDVLDFDTFNIGVKVTAERSIGDCSAFYNANAFILEEAEESFSLVNSPTLTILSGISGLGFLTVDSLFANYNTNLYGAEVNRRDEFGFFSTYFGIRFVHFDEEFNVSQTGTANNPAFVPVPVTGFRSITTRNDMVGLNIGLDTLYPIGDYLKIGTVSKFGLMANFTDVEITQGVTNSVIGPRSLTTGDTDVQFAQVIDASAVVTLRLTTNIEIRGGYQLLYLSRMTLAGEQTAPSVFLTTPQIIDDGGNVFYHGPFAAVEIKWGLCQ